MLSLTSCIFPGERNSESRSAGRRGRSRRTLDGGKEGTTRGGTVGGCRSQLSFLDNFAQNECCAVRRPNDLKQIRTQRSRLSSAGPDHLIKKKKKVLVDLASHNYIYLFAKFQNLSDSHIGLVYLDTIIVP